MSYNYDLNTTGPESLGPGLYKPIQDPDTIVPFDTKLALASKDRKPLALYVDRIAFSYSRKKPILRSISLAIPEGQIFALLGSNGCGKTTLLRICLGRLTPTSGSVKVFGIVPGSTHSTIPGPGVGYMPQEISLIPEFTISETLQYFGSIYHLKPEVVRDRIKELIEFLNLPNEYRLVRNLSGGQKRLVSMAVTLIHRPPLVILDEPTVGVDSVLRHRIWKYLEELTNNHGTTIIITTHYIEEAKEAHQVAFVDSGRILAQSTPKRLQEKYNCSTLEEVFFKLCLHRYTGKEDDSVERFVEMSYNSDDNVSSERTLSLKERFRKEIDGDRLKAMLWKSVVRVRRNPFIFVMFHLIPIVTLILFTLTFLRPPHSMPIAIYPGDKHGGQLSKNFVRILDDYFLKKKIFLNASSALDSVRRGESVTALLFSDNFSDAFTSRYIDVYRSEVEDDIIEESKIKQYPDNSNFIFSFYMQRAVLRYFEDFMRTFAMDRGYNPITFNLPIDVKPPIYGKMETDLGHYLVSALIVVSLYALPMVVASLQIVTERRDGLQERAFVAGVRPLEILSSHMLTCFVALCSQVTITIILTFYIFKLECVGSVFEIFLLILLQGIQGLSVGLLISMLSADTIFAAVAIISLILPMLLCSGSMWPMEGIPELLQNVMFLNPLTLTIRSVRLVMLRGWSYRDFQVFVGYVTTSSYTALTFVSSIVIFQIICDNDFSIPLLSHLR